jgi:hypothetical protein
MKWNEMEWNGMNDSRPKVEMKKRKGVDNSVKRKWRAKSRARRREGEPRPCSLASLLFPFLYFLSSVAEGAHDHLAGKLAAPSAKPLHVIWSPLYDMILRVSITIRVSNDALEENVALRFAVAVSIEIVGCAFEGLPSSL